MFDFFLNTQNFLVIVYALYIRLFTFIYLFLLKRYAHDIFATGQPTVPTQQKKAVATNTMHFQSTYAPPQIYSTSSQIHIWNPVGGLRWSFLRKQPKLAALAEELRH